MRQARLRRFWGIAIFSLGLLWGLSNLVYLPIAALTSFVGSSWFEVAIIFAGGLLTFSASIVAFYRRRPASLSLLAGGILLLVLAVYRHTAFPSGTHGAINLSLLFLAGSVAIVLGLFGILTDIQGWPTLLNLT